MCVCVWGGGQLCAGASASDRARLHLGPSTDHSVLCQSPCHVLPGVDDAEEYRTTCHAMASVGMSQDRSGGAHLPRHTRS